MSSARVMIVLALSVLSFVDCGHQYINLCVHQLQFCLVTCPVQFYLRLAILGEPWRDLIEIGTNLCQAWHFPSRFCTLGGLAINNYKNTFINSVIKISLHFLNSCYHCFCQVELRCSVVTGLMIKYRTFESFQYKRFLSIFLCQIFI